MELKKTKRLISIQSKYFVNCFRYHKSRYTKNSVTCIIFSRDRAMQLETLLNSIERYALKDFDIIVQYSFSPNHEQSYQQLINEFPNVLFVKETSVNKTLKEILKNIKSKYMFYLVDDQVFIRDFDVTKALHLVNKQHFFSMRLGKTITNWGIMDKPLSPQYDERDGFLHWKYQENKKVSDWRYKFSVDGHIYRTIDILRCTMSIPFKAPNSYEANMNSVLFFKRAKGCSAFSYPVVVNLIINASRQESDYDDCVGGEYTADDLLKMKEKGYDFDLDKIAKIPYNSAHYIIKNIKTILIWKK